MTDPAEGVMNILTTEGIGTPGNGSGWRLWVAKEPDVPDQAITSYNTGSWRAPDPKWLLDFPSIQVRIRGATADYQNTYIKAQEVKDALLGLTPQTLNGDFWRSVVIRGDITFLLFDQKERPVFVINLALYIEPAATAQSSRLALS